MTHYQVICYRCLCFLFYLAIKCKKKKKKKGYKQRLTSGYQIGKNAECICRSNRAVTFAFIAP